MKTMMKMKMEKDIKDRVQFYESADQSAGQKIKMKSSNENMEQSKRNE